MQDSVFVRLQLLPLFQGISRDELLRMLERTKFNFASCDSEEVVVNQGEMANNLVYALSGSYSVERVFSNDLRIEEELEAPFIFEPECLFSKSSTWRHTLKTQTECQLLFISKHDLIAHLLDFPTFRLSLLCYLCRLSDVSELEERASFPLTLHESFTQYLKQRIITLDGRKVIYIRMKDLAKRLSTSRLAVSTYLNQLQGLGVLTLGRKVIEIRDLSSLLTLQNLCV